MARRYSVCCHWHRATLRISCENLVNTGVDKGGAGGPGPPIPCPAPPMAGQEFFFVKIEPIEALLEPVVLNLSFTALECVLTLCLHLKDDISVTDILKISKIT